MQSFIIISATISLLFVNALTAAEPPSTDNPQIGAQDSEPTPPALKTPNAIIFSVDLVPGLAKSGQRLETEKLVKHRTQNGCEIELPQSLELGEVDGGVVEDGKTDKKGKELSFSANLNSGVKDHENFHLYVKFKENCLPLDLTEENGSWFLTEDSPDLNRSPAKIIGNKIFRESETWNATYHRIEYLTGTRNTSCCLEFNMNLYPSVNPSVDSNNVPIRTKNARLTPESLITIKKIANRIKIKLPTSNFVKTPAPRAYEEMVKLYPKDERTLSFAKLFWGVWKDERFNLSEAVVKECPNFKSYAMWQVANRACNRMVENKKGIEVPMGVPCTEWSAYTSINRRIINEAQKHCKGLY